MDNANPSAGFQFVLLSTDLLVWLLLLTALGALWWVRRQPLVRAGWAQVGQSPGAMAAATLLGLFVLVGLADSLHYRAALPGPGPEGKVQYGVEVFSLLDKLVSGLRERTEKTYSAPLATRLDAMQAVPVQRPDGSLGQTRGYPRLRHGGAHLSSDDPASWQADVLGRVGLGVLTGALLWGGLCLLVVGRQLPRQRTWKQAWRQAWQDLWRGRWQPDARGNLAPPFAWRGVLTMAGLLLLVLTPLLFLAGSYHVFGTDKVGQDVAYQVLKSIRTALVIGIVTTLVTLPLGVILGLLAGFLRGWVDDVIQYLYTTLNSIPSVLLIAASVLMVQGLLDLHPQWFATAQERADLRLLALCVILGMTSWTGLARLLRGEALKLRELEYVQAAQAFGVSAPRILLRHILPNVMHLVIIALVMDFSGLVLAEAVLSYVGIGVDPSTISFGTMINNARMELAREPAIWWSLTFAFCVMVGLVLAANVLADAVRDAFDPRWSPGGRA